jgi:hypothetical protein
MSPFTASQPHSLTSLILICGFAMYRVDTSGQAEKALWREGWEARRRGRGDAGSSDHSPVSRISRRQGIESTVSCLRSAKQEFCELDQSPIGNRSAESRRLVDSSLVTRHSSLVTHRSLRLDRGGSVVSDKGWL